MAETEGKPDSKSGVLDLHCTATQFWEQKWKVQHISCSRQAIVGEQENFLNESKEMESEEKK